ncbi:MAG: murein biosynthesis integral membrane protein MurJ [Chloroflexi bacterium]|nr:murein biosynthesis integral membrane protein MurJ [Chloroflexota bacterium]
MTQSPDPSQGTPVDETASELAAARRGSAIEASLNAALIVGSGFAASKVLGLLRNVVIGNQYGASHEYEMFLAALTVPDTLFQILAGGAVGSAFIPVFTGYLAGGDRASAWRLTSSLATLAVIGLGLAGVLLGFAAPLLIAAIVPGWNSADQERTTNLVRIMLASPAIFALSTLATSTLNGLNRFALAAAAPLVYNLSLCAGAIFLRPWGVEGLALSAVAGALLHLLVQIPGLIAVGLRFAPTLGIRLDGTREVLALMIPRMAGLGISQVNQVITVALASFLGEGSIAYLSYAWLILMVPLGVAAMGIATALFPSLSRDMAAGRADDARGTFRLGLGLVLAISLLSTLGLVILGPSLVGILFGRGAFGAEAVAATAFALGWYALGLAGHGTIEMVSRGFYAIRDTATPVRAAAMGASINIGLSLVLMRTPLSYGGLALANGIAALCEASLLVVLLHHRLGWVGRSAISQFTRALLPVGLAFGLGCLIGRAAVTHYLSPDIWPGQLAIVTSGAALGLALAAATYLSQGGLNKDFWRLT